MDFVEIVKKPKSNGGIEILPAFKVRRSKDLMVKGNRFYAIWNPNTGLWSKDIYDVANMIDSEIYKAQESLGPDIPSKAVTLSDFSSKKWTEFLDYVKSQPDTKKVLDDHIVFSNQEVKKEDYVSHVLPYPLEEGPFDAYEELVSTLYLPEERQKIEWAIGAIVSGDSKDIQKFIAFYGEGGSGKSTMINIIQMLFEGYYTTFDAKALGMSNNQFATEAFKNNPLVAIQHDGDLSRIEDNTKLNSIIAHEEMTVNEKYKANYTNRSSAFLFIGTNKPVKITDAKSGLIRRLIDVRPSGNRVPFERYQVLMNRIGFELGGIAWHCLQVYNQLGKGYYDAYRPIDMMYQTDVFFNFVEWNYELFKTQNSVTLKQAYDLYKQYCEDAFVENKLQRHKFREELKNYFRYFDESGYNVDGQRVRSLYRDFLVDKFNRPQQVESKEYQIVLDKTVSVLDEQLKDCKAQYATVNGTPKKKWENVKTVLSDLDTKKEHYIIPPGNLIVIDFDLKNESGEKDAERNIIEASKWPPTYTEFSKSGKGIHLHYYYDGDVKKLSPLYDNGIEIKFFTGGSALRRKLSFCNAEPVATISHGLPLREEKSNLFNPEFVKNEKIIRSMIQKNLRKEYHPSTKSSIDYIYKILDDSYNEGVRYDVTDMRQKVLTFAMKSTNNSRYCINLVGKMKFKGKNMDDLETLQGEYDDDTLVFFDCEVYPNLFVICWKYKGADKVFSMINPSAAEVESLFKMKLIGFNNRRYDNHILYARYLGYSNEELFRLSQNIILDKSKLNSYFFSEAYGISYTDVHDFCSKKQSLKKWEIELGIKHQEMDIPWNQPVPEELWDKICEYCSNDVNATEATFDANQGDWTARQILADLSGLTVNDTTNQHTKRIIFGNNKHPQGAFNYVDLSQPITYIPEAMHKFLYENTTLPIPAPGEIWDQKDWFEPGVSMLPYFPGYKYENGISTYRGEVVGEGGYVYSEPGAYWDTPILDVESMHPSSLEDMWHFGVYTTNFSQIKKSRILIKHEDYDSLMTILDGKLAKYVVDHDASKMSSLSYALKIAINSVYGLTSASFENECRDPRNVDNIVAKRGALFMIDLKHYVQDLGFTVAHIKTDSIKIPNATPDVIDKVMAFGRKYGYKFEHEATYEKMCLVDKANYIAKVEWGKHQGEWTVTGDKFDNPVPYKMLFSHEPIVPFDFSEVKSVSDADIWIDFNGQDRAFVGRIGRFTPVKPDSGGGDLIRVGTDGKEGAVAGSKGYKWEETERLLQLGEEEFYKKLDNDFYHTLVEDTLSMIRKYCDPEVFIGDDSLPPWWECSGKCETCVDYWLCGGLPF